MKKGQKMSEEQKQKISKANKGHVVDEKTKKKISNKLNGIIVKKEAIEKRLRTIEERGGVWNKGKHLSKEIRHKMSESAKGRIPWNKGKKGVQSSTRKGKTYEEIYGMERNNEICKKMINSHKGQAAWNKGISPSKETREKISKSQMGEKNHNFGKVLSDEQKRKISDSEKGKVVSIEVGKKISKSNKGKHSGEKNPNFGKKLSDDVKNKIREKLKGEKSPLFGKSPWNKGMIQSQEIIEKRRIAMKGIVFSNEHKQHLKESARASASAEMQAYIQEGHELARSIRQWKAIILERDDYKCKIVGCNSIKCLDAHHIIPQSVDFTKRLLISNGITLCVKHHAEQHPENSIRAMFKRRLDKIDS